MRSYLAQVISFAALVLTAIALIPGGAHVFERSAKMALGREDYFVVQGIYRGWAWFGAVIIAALISCAALAAISKGRDRILSLFAAIMIAFSLAIFFAFVFPANQATQNWTAIPQDWRDWRFQWEWGHAAAAVCTFLAFVTLAWKTAVRPGNNA
ncbi:MAG: DUF1772 domain-containing protein [Rhodomicrobium sp.]|nr:DUF1772 domain-containing protein [Rhodomicrobium sp.]